MIEKTLRIAFATPEYVTEKYFDSGIATYVYRTAKALTAMGHEIHVVTKSERDQDTFRHEGITVHRVSFGRTWLQLNRLTRYRLSTTMHLLGLSAQVYRKLKQLHREQPFHLLQFPNCSYCGLFSILFLNVPHVLRASWYQPLWKHADEIGRGFDSKAEELLERLQFRFSPHIYTPSYTLQRVLRYERKLRRVQVIRNPFFRENSNWDESVYEEHLKGKRYSLFFGRFELRKGFHILAWALPAVLEKYPDSYFVLVGRDQRSPFAQSMADYARSLCGGSNRLIVMKALPHSQLYPIIAGSRLVVLPSLIDNFPNACLEAMALGKPVIGTIGASFDEIINDERDGFLVTANDRNALAKKIIDAWSHPRLDEIGRAAKQRISDLSADTTLESLLSYYKEVLQSAN